MGRAEARRWLAAARDDLAYAQHAADGGFHAPACFHAQQAAEKAVKAVHYDRGAKAVLGHSVGSLIEALSPREAALDGQRDAARELDLFFITSRLPQRPRGRHAGRGVLGDPVLARAGAGTPGRGRGRRAPPGGLKWRRGC
jgi:HEPN domain-containing protein